MKHLFLVVAATLLSVAADSALAAFGKEEPTACWLETSASTMDAALGGAGIQETPEWHSTISSVLIRHRKGDVLIDAGFARDAEAQMSELPERARIFGLQIVAGAKNRTSISDALAAVRETPAQLTRIVITHGHYDHLGGASELAAPVYVSPAEFQWLAEQANHPIITPPSLVIAVQSRLRPLAYRSGPFLGFESSDDIYGDGTIVVVPLPGHTPGSQGVFLTLHRRRVFLIGDAADTLEAAVRGLPKNAAIREATDFDPEQADAQTEKLASFHRLHPEIPLIPAHDRDAFAAVFGDPAECISRFRGVP